jgi:hypothetical protein
VLQRNALAAARHQVVESDGGQPVEVTPESATLLPEQMCGDQLGICARRCDPGCRKVPLGGTQGLAQREPATGE